MHLLLATGHQQVPPRQERFCGYEATTRYLGNVFPTQHPVLGGYEYRDLALQVVEVSNETKIWSLSSAGLGHRYNCKSKLQTHPHVREGAPYQQTRNCQRENK
jgi:hypothetical protein